MQRRLSYVEKLPAKRTVASGGIVSGNLATASVTRNNVTFGVVKPLSEKPAIGAATPEDYDNVYYDSDTGALTGIDQNGDEFNFTDPGAQSTADGAASSASTALIAANGKNKVFHQPTAPTNAQLSGVTLAVDDIWFNTDTGNRPSKYLSQKTITNKQVTSKVATLTTSANHGFAIGDIVYIVNVGSPFNGTFNVTSVPTLTTFTYELDTANIGSTGASGTADGWRPYGYGSLAVTNIDASSITTGVLTGRTINLAGGQITYTDFTIVKKGYLSSIAQIETSTNHGLSVGDAITVTGLGAPWDGQWGVSSTTGYGTAGKIIQYVLSSDPNEYGYYATQDLTLTAEEGTLRIAQVPSDFTMTVSPSLDVSMYPIQDFDANDSVYSPGMTVSQVFSGGFANIDAEEFHIVTGAYGSHTTSAPFISNFGAVFGISTGGTSPTDQVGAGLNSFVDSTQLWDGSRAAVVAKLYGDIIQISTVTTSTDITVSSTNIDSTGSYGDHKTILNYGAGYLEGQGGVQKGTIAWTDATVSAATLGGGKAGDIVFKFD
jgi:hypothetical protein